MAGIGLYGVFYSKCVKNGDVVTGYDGSVKMMGKAISAGFEPNTPEDNPLYANNGVGENDYSTGSGGALTMTLDRLTLNTSADLFGTQAVDVEVTVGDQTVKGKEITYKGDEVSVPVGAAYIKMQQEDGERSHEVVFYREVEMARPSEDAQTMGETLEWQTPEISGTVAGLQGDGSQPWYRASRWPTQESAIAYVFKLFGSTATPEQIARIVNFMNEEIEVGV